MGSFRSIPRRLVRFLEDTAEALRSVVHGFRGEAINLRAGNLTFISIFSLVPLLTVALAGLQLLHQETFHDRIFKFVQELLAPGVSAASAEFLQRFFTEASARAAGGVSFLFLIISAAMLLRHLDASLNAIWAVRRRRPVGISIALYLLVLTIGPFCLAMALLGFGGIRDALAEVITWLPLPFPRQLLKLLAAMFSVIAFSLLYKYAPHAPVRWRSAFAGGLLGGLGWEIARQIYAQFAEAGFSRNPVYGSLSAVPLFLTWIWLSWWLVLFGARLAYAVEHAAYRGEFQELVSHPRAHELVAARIAQITAVAFARNAPAPTGRDIARRLQVPEKLVMETVQALERAGLLTVQPKGGLWPAREPASLTLADVSAAVGGVAKFLRKDRDAVGRTERHSLEFAELERAYAEVDDVTEVRLGAISWARLAELSQKSP